MDAFAGMLDGPRARQAFLLRMLLDPPWSIWVDDRAPLALVAALRGEAWVTIPGSEPARLAAGEVAIVCGPEPYAFADPPDTPTQVVALPGGMCTTTTGESVMDSLRRGVRTMGNTTTGSTEVLIGAYEHVNELGSRLLAALPRLAVVPAADLGAPLVDLLGAEMVKEAPGQQVVLDRLLDLLVVAVLRAWFACSDDTPGWFKASSDPVVGPALRLLQDNPAHPWTVAGLAAEVGASRATLARRFTDLVGEPPMTYLTERRLALAADLLKEPGTTVAAVARQVGYANPFALSAAFKRVHGFSPREYQRRTA